MTHSARPQQVRVQSFNISRDGIGAGEAQSFTQPFGLADAGDLFAWVGATADWNNRDRCGCELPARAHASRAELTSPHDPGGTRGLDDYIARDFTRNIGAEIMGRNKFGPQRGPWPDHDWQGWWGDEPPFHTPVFVLTHHARPSFTLSDTTFHFLDTTPHDAVQQAKGAANGQDVRIGGGVTTIREFLEADLIDEMHIAMAPCELGSGLRLWDSPEELTDRFHLERVLSPSGVVHHFFWRR